MKHIEDREQIALITWVRLMATKYPALDLVFHTPNGGYRDIRTAAKFKAMGLKPGVWDIFVPVPAPGLWVEMKAGKGRLTPGQASFRDQLEPHGYSFAVAYSWHEAARAIGLHLGIDDIDLV
jgi:hypothetical protein